MAIVYFDSSAFVKLVVEEEGSDLAAALWDGCDAAVSSRLVYPEVAPRWPQRGAPIGWTLMRGAKPKWRGRSSGPRPGRWN